MTFTKYLFITLCTSLVCFAQQTINGSITHDDLQRDYILYVPANYTGNEPVPLVFNFHGFTGSAANQMTYGDFRPVADSAGFLIVHPQGTLFNGSTHWNVGGWTVGSTVDDVGFTEALIDSLAAAYNIDMARIYSTGFSNGGYMSFLLACQLGNRIAAIASVAGSMTPETYNACVPQHPTPALQFHGTSDGVVPYNGAAWTKPVNDVIQYWLGYNNCNVTPAVTPIVDIDSLDGSTVEHFAYGGGDNDVSTEHFKISGGAHTWPGTASGGFGTNYDIDASHEIWQFFSRYDINGLITPTATMPSTMPVFAEFQLFQNYPNPFNPSTKITFKIPRTARVTIKVFDISGQEIASLVDRDYPTGTHSTVWDASGIAAGVYIYRLQADGFSQSKRLTLIK